MRLPEVVVPVGLLVVLLLLLLLMPLSAVFVFAFRGGLGAFRQALWTPESHFAMRFSVLVAFATAFVNAILGTFAAYVLSKFRFPGRGALNTVVNLPIAIPTVVVGTSLLLLWGRSACSAACSSRTDSSRCSRRWACCSRTCS